MAFQRMDSMIDVINKSKGLKSTTAVHGLTVRAEQVLKSICTSYISRIDLNTEYNKQHLTKVMFGSFPNNNHTLWIVHQTEKLQPHCARKETDEK